MKNPHQLSDGSTIDLNQVALLEGPREFEPQVTYVVLNSGYRFIATLKDYLSMKEAIFARDR